MKKILFVLMFIALCGIVYAGSSLNQGQVDMKVGVYGTKDGTTFDSVQGAADTATIEQKTVTTGGQEYEMTIPAGTKELNFQARTAVESRIAFLSGDVSETAKVDATGPYYTVKSGTVFTLDGLDLASNLTLYGTVTPSGDSTILELQTWK